MPHKRAKPAVREQIRSRKGNDLAPGQFRVADEAVPKSAARILNAAKIQETWKEKRKRHEQAVTSDGASPNAKRRKSVGKDDGPGKLRPSLAIQPGESIQQFNRRVESDMRHVVNSTIQASSKLARKRRKQGLAGAAPDQSQKSVASDDAGPASPKHDRVLEFPTISSSLPRRLNEVVVSPPVIKHLPRGVAGKPGTAPGKREGILSLAQKAMMETEREKAILRYRELRDKAKTTIPDDRGVSLEQR